MGRPSPGDLHDTLSEASSIRVLASCVRSSTIISQVELFCYVRLITDV